MRQNCNCSQYAEYMHHLSKWLNTHKIETFKFCPWCGRELEELPVAQEQPDNHDLHHQFQPNKSM